MVRASSVSSQVEDPHALEKVWSEGPAPEKAEGTLVLVHGRGGTAEDMLSLYEALDLPGLAALAPQAAGHTWYPQSFLRPLEENEPYLSSAIGTIEAVVADLLRRGVGAERIALLGFSQGACLVLEFAARHPRRYGGVMGLTGGLIGPAGTPRDYGGSLAGTKVFMGAGDPDPHVPWWRVEETAEVLERMGASIALKRYAGMGHTINEEELAICRGMLMEMMAQGGSR